MQKVIILLLVTVLMQLNCGTIAAEELEQSQPVGDYSTEKKEKKHA